MVAIELLKEIWKLTLEASPYLLIGFVFAGVIKAFLKDEFIQKFIGKKSTKSVFFASLIGIPLPICSCGVVPVATSLKKQGASSGASMSFLVSTPETGIDSIAITYGMLGGFMTLVRPIAAFFTAIAVGITENIFGEEIKVEEVKSCCASSSCGSKKVVVEKPITEKLKEGFVYSFTDLFADISKYLAIGLVIGGMISYLIPTDVIQTFDGNVLGMLGMLFLGIPLYICATSSTPIAAALLLKGMSPGTALVFLLVGPATNIASLVIIQKVFGKKSTALYLVVIAICSIIFGLLTDYFFQLLGVNPIASIQETNEMIPHWFAISSSIVVVGLIFYFEVFKKLKGKFGQKEKAIA